MKTQKQIREQMWEDDFNMDARFMPERNKYFIRHQSSNKAIFSFDTAELKEKYFALRKRAFNKTKKLKPT